MTALELAYHAGLLGTYSPLEEMILTTAQATGDA
jgi:hypothetical protein